MRNNPQPVKDQMASFLPFELPLQRRLTKMYTDTKSSLAFASNPAGNEDAELQQLYRKLRIQKDRLTTWGLRWSEATEGQPGTTSDAPPAYDDIDESLSRAGLADVVGSIMGTIKDILAEAEPLWKASGAENTSFSSRAAEKAAEAKMLIVWDRARFEDLVKDLTSSIDTLYDISRMRQGRPSKLKTQKPKIELVLRRESTFEKSRMETTKTIDPEQLRNATGSSIVFKNGDGSQTLVVEGGKQILYMRKEASGFAPTGSTVEVPVLVEIATYDEDLFFTGVGHPKERFERLFNALHRKQDDTERPDFGSLNLIGSFEDARDSRIGLVYEIPSRLKSTLSMPSSSDSKRLSVPRPYYARLADILSHRYLEPALEVKFRLAYNLASSVFDLHSRGFVHGSIAACNITFFEDHATHTSGSDDWLSSVDLRRPYLTSYDLFTEPANQDGKHLREPADVTWYRHKLDPRLTEKTTFTTESQLLDLYSLALLLLEIGLWQSSRELKDGIGGNSLRIDVKEDPAAVYKLLAARCGTSYRNAIRACWEGVEQKASDQKSDERGRSDVYLQSVYGRVLSALEKCCAIEDTEDEGDAPMSNRETPPMLPPRSMEQISSTGRGYWGIPLPTGPPSPMKSKQSERFSELVHQNYTTYMPRPWPWPINPFSAIPKHVQPFDESLRREVKHTRHMENSRKKSLAQERLLLELRDNREPKPDWQATLKEFNDMTGKNYKVPALQMKYARLKEKLRVSGVQDADLDPDLHQAPAVQQNNMMKLPTDSPGYSNYGLYELNEASRQLTKALNVSPSTAIEQPTLFPSNSYNMAEESEAVNPPMSVVQPENMRRQRLLSVRTQTTCVACRQRSKMCDKGKPQCFNCAEGGFVCTPDMEHKSTLEQTNPEQTFGMTDERTPLSAASLRTTSKHTYARPSQKVPKIKNVNISMATDSHLKTKEWVKDLEQNNARVLRLAKMEDFEAVEDFPKKPLHPPRRRPASSRDASQSDDNNSELFCDTDWKSNPTTISRRTKASRSCLTGNEDSDVSDEYERDLAAFQISPHHIHQATAESKKKKMDDFERQSLTEPLTAGFYSMQKPRLALAQAKADEAVIRDDMGDNQKTIEHYKEAAEILQEALSKTPDGESRKNMESIVGFKDSQYADSANTSQRETHNNRIIELHTNLLFDGGSTRERRARVQFKETTEDIHDALKIDDVEVSPPRGISRHRMPRQKLKLSPDAPCASSGEEGPAAGIDVPTSSGVKDNLGRYADPEFDGDESPDFTTIVIMEQPEDGNVLDQLFTSLMYKRAWNKLSEASQQQILAYPAAKKWSLICQEDGLMSEKSFLSLEGPENIAYITKRSYNKLVTISRITGCRIQVPAHGVNHVIVKISGHVHEDVMKASRLIQVAVHEARIQPEIARGVREISDDEDTCMGHFGKHSKYSKHQGITDEGFLWDLTTAPSRISLQDNDNARLSPHEPQQEASADPPADEETRQQKPRRFPTVKLMQEHLDNWHQYLMPQINQALRKFYRKHPESVEISFEAVGESPHKVKPTILVVCTSVSKVKSVLKRHFSYDSTVYGLMVCKGKIVRSRKKPTKRSALHGSNDPRPRNIEVQERPLNGASIGAYAEDQALPAVTFGGIVMVDGQPFGLTVHHMFDLPSDDDEEDGSYSSVPTMRSSDSERYPRRAPIAADISGEDLGFELSDYDSETCSEYCSSEESEYNSEEEGEIGDIAPIPKDCTDGYYITHPAFSDANEDFLRGINAEMVESQERYHLENYKVGDLYVSSGIRRRQCELQHIHEIDWALFKFVEDRRPFGNRIKGASSFCAAKTEYPTRTVPFKELPGLEVHANARTTGLTRGHILQGLASVKMKGRQTPSQSYMIAGGLGIPGDSGAWVMENKEGRACGHILAWSERKNVAYFCPMDVMLQDIRDELGATVVDFPKAQAMPIEDFYYRSNVDTVGSQFKRVNLCGSQRSPLQIIDDNVKGRSVEVSVPRRPVPSILKSAGGGQVQEIEIVNGMESICLSGGLPIQRSGT